MKNLERRFRCSLPLSVGGIRQTQPDHKEERKGGIEL
jgi:hypothetical protein